MKIDLGTGILSDLWGLNDSLDSEIYWQVSPFDRGFTIVFSFYVDG